MEFASFSNSFRKWAARSKPISLRKAIFVDVVGTSKGRGFQGVVKRHNFQVVSVCRPTVSTTVFVPQVRVERPRSRPAYGRASVLPVTWA